VSLRKRIAPAAIAVGVSAWLGIACSGGDSAPAPPTPAKTPVLAAALLAPQDLGETFNPTGPPVCLSARQVATAGNGLVRSCGVAASDTSGGLATVRSQLLVFDSEVFARSYVEAYDDQFLLTTYTSALQGFVAGPSLELVAPVVGDEAKALLMRVNGPLSATGEQSVAAGYIVVFRTESIVGQMIYETYGRAIVPEQEIQRLADLMFGRIGQLPGSVRTPEPLPASPVAAATPPPAASPPAP
jgi:hypothetical protein